MMVLTNDLLQLCRLAFTLAGLAILLSLLPRQHRYMEYTGNRRTNIGQMLAPAEVKPHSIELHTIPFTMRDGIMLTIIVCALFVLALL